MEDKKQHCLLGGSSSERWINCPPSARLTEDMEDVTSVYAEEGSNAHALAEYKLNRAIGVNLEYPKLTIFNKEMDEYTDSYVSFVLEQIEALKEEDAGNAPYVMVEHQVSYDKWVNGSFGTIDFLAATNKTLHIIDFKYGLGVKVDATENSQLKIYALGAIQELECLYDFEKIILTIYQPRIGNVSTWETAKSDLLKWGEEVLKPAAELADKGEGIFRSGPWCKFCKARAICKERSKVALDILNQEFRNPNLLSDNEIEEVLLKADDISSYLNDIKDFAVAKALDGKKWINFKLVEGRSTRKFTDEGSVINVLKDNNINPYDTKLRSITDIEKELGKAKFKSLLEQYVNKPQGKPTLVLRSDKREELNLVNTDFDVFKEEK